jgi:hypothetical protein
LTRQLHTCTLAQSFLKRTAREIIIASIIIIYRAQLYSRRGLTAIISALGVSPRRVKTHTARAGTLNIAFPAEQGLMRILLQPRSWANRQRCKCKGPFRLRLAVAARLRECPPLLLVMLLHKSSRMLHYSLAPRSGFGSSVLPGHDHCPIAGRPLRQRFVHTVIHEQSTDSLSRGAQRPWFTHRMRICFNVECIEAGRSASGGNGHGEPVNDSPQARPAHHCTGSGGIHSPAHLRPT